MSCFENAALDDELTPEMAQEGITEEEFELLKLEVELARETAKREAFNSGYTLVEQEDLMDLAEQEARAIAHDRHHRRSENESKEFFGSLHNAIAKRKEQVH